MFDLEKALNDWRSDYRNAMQMPPSTIAELESHLRDTIDQLAEDLPLEQAFTRAVDQLGPPAELASEFQKNNDLSFVDKLVLRGHHLFLFVLLALILAIGIPYGKGVGGPLLGIHVGFILLGYGISLFFGLVGCYSILRSRSEAIAFSHTYRNYSRRFCFLAFSGTLVGLILGMIWAKQAWGNYFGWNPREIGALTVTLLALGFFAFQWRRTLSLHHLAQMNLALSITTMLAWFGASGSLATSGVMMHSLFCGWITIQLLAFSLPWFVPAKKIVT